MTAYHLTVARLRLNPAGPATPIEHAVRRGMAPHAARAAVREIIRDIKTGAIVDAQHRDATDQPWVPVLRGSANKLWMLSYDAWPTCVTYQIQHHIDTSDGPATIVTRLTLEPAAERTDWSTP
jgi:hypothetical protein